MTRSRPRQPATGVDAQRSLRHVWYWTVGRLACTLVGLTLVAFAATNYQRTQFDAYSSQLETEIAVLIAVDEAIVDLELPVFGVLYGLGDRSSPQEYAQRYETARLELNAQFDAAAHVITGTTGGGILADAVRSWQVMDRGMSEGAIHSDSPEHRAAVEAGLDPYEESVWRPYAAMGEALLDLRMQSADDLAARTERLRRIASFSGLALGVALVLALGLTAHASRRVTRKVLSPLVALRDAAVAMRGGEQGGAFQLPGAVAELQQLAATLQSTDSALRATHGLLRDRAHTDSLTGLANRSALTEFVEAQLAHRDGVKLGMLFIDLDNFKGVNDSFGHQAGDAVLKVAAERIRGAARAMDLVARLGGDEFAVAFDCDGPEASRVAGRIIATFANPIEIGQHHSITIGCSVGVAFAPAHENSSYDDLAHKADLAMYNAKAQGKNRFAVYSSGPLGLRGSALREPTSHK